MTPEQLSALKTELAKPQYAEFVKAGYDGGLAGLLNETDPKLSRAVNPNSDERRATYLTLAAAFGLPLAGTVRAIVEGGTALTDGTQFLWKIGHEALMAGRGGLDMADSGVHAMIDGMPILTTDQKQALKDFATLPASPALAILGRPASADDATTARLAMGG